LFIIGQDFVRVDLLRAAGSVVGANCVQFFHAMTILPSSGITFPRISFAGLPSSPIAYHRTCIYVLIPRYTNPRKRNTERKLRKVVTFTSWVDRIELYTDQRLAMLSPAVPPELLQLTSTFFFAVLLVKTRQRRKHCVSVEVKLLPVPPSRLHVRRLLKSDARNCALLDVLQSSPLVCRVATQAVQYARNSSGTRPILAQGLNKTIQTDPCTLHGNIGSQAQGQFSLNLSGRGYVREIDKHD